MLISQVEYIKLVRIVSLFVHKEPQSGAAVTALRGPEHQDLSRKSLPLLAPIAASARYFFFHLVREAGRLFPRNPDLRAVFLADALMLGEIFIWH